jgi:predicted Zn-dependent peptidase
MSRFSVFLSVLLVPIFISATFAPKASAQSAYSPPGLYDVEQVRLANGFRAILKQRTGARNVSLRLVVNIGTRHFDCPHRETPHLIEHLLFTGTSHHTEVELDRMIEEHGGTWNATTGSRYTIYEVDIFDRYAELALNTLYEIMTDTAFTESKVSNVKDIVFRESGGKPTIVRRFLYRLGIGKAAWKKANEWLLPGTGAMCPGLPDFRSTTAGDLTATFKTSYVPGNMFLIIVGNFDRNVIIRQLRRTFGSLAPTSPPDLMIHTPPYPAGGPVRVTGTFAPFLGSNGYVGVAYRTAGEASPDLPAISVLTSYLDKRLYEELRIKNGLSYGPEVSQYLRPDYGLLYITADTGISNANRVNRLVHDTLERLKQKPPNKDEIEGIKLRLLLRWAQGYETNAGTADFYVENLPELQRRGAFRNYAKGIEQVTATDVARVATEYFRSANRVDVWGIPTLSYTQFYVFIGFVLFVAVTVVALLLRYRARVMRRKLPSYIRKF